MARPRWTEPVPVRRVEARADHPLPDGEWPLTLGPVRQLLDRGLDLGRATVLVGENGSGKSTLVEAIAMAYGLGPEGGSTGARTSTFVSESPLHTALQLVRGAGASRWGYFFRAETMHNLFSYLAAHTRTGLPSSFSHHHASSHGESFHTLLAEQTVRFDGGLLIFDEPEAGLSFSAQLQLLGELGELAAHPRGQVIVATHSPVIAALPGARLLELTADGLVPTSWEDLSVVDHYRRFTARPEAYLRHLID